MSPRRCSRKVRLKAVRSAGRGAEAGRAHVENEVDEQPLGPRRAVRAEVDRAGAGGGGGPSGGGPLETAPPRGDPGRPAPAPTAAGRVRGRAYGDDLRSRGLSSSRRPSNFARDATASVSSRSGISSRLATVATACQARRRAARSTAVQPEP